MSTKLKMDARSKIIGSIRALPQAKAREEWARRLGGVLYEMQKKDAKGEGVAARNITGAANGFSR